MVPMVRAPGSAGAAEGGPGLYSGAWEAVSTALVTRPGQSQDLSFRVGTALGLVTRFLDCQRGTWIMSSVPAGEDHAGLAVRVWWTPRYPWALGSLKVSECEEVEGGHLVSSAWS